MKASEKTKPIIRFAKITFQKFKIYKSIIIRIAMVLYKILIIKNMNKIKPTKKEQALFDLLVESYPNCVIAESLDAMLLRFASHQYKRAMLHRHLRKLCYCDLLEEIGKVGKTGKVIVYKIKK